MSVLASPAALLGWLGRQGTRAIAASIFIGLIVPPLAALMKPLFGISLVLLMTAAFLRVDPAALRVHIRRPRLALIATVWVMFVTPAIGASLCVLSGLAKVDAGIYLGVIFQLIASPVTASAAISSLLRFDSALSLVVLVIGTTLLPFTAMMFAYVFVPPAITLSPLGLGVGLMAMLAGAAAIAALVRRIAGHAFIERHSEHFDGVSVCAMTVFAIAAMDGVAAQLIASPFRIFALLGLAFAVTFCLAAAAALAFRRFGRPAALALAVSTGSRNIALMVAAAAGSAPESTWLYVALAQFPIFLMPQLARSFLLRLWPEKPH